jgi:antitoxin component of MazEF toxin-antitoxin module
MLAKITAKNQLTLPKSLIQAVGATEYFDVEARGGQLILTPVRIQRGDAVRAKLAELDLTDTDMAAAVAWARSPAFASAMVNETAAGYEATPAKPKKAATQKTGTKKAMPSA